MSGIRLGCSDAENLDHARLSKVARTGFVIVVSVEFDSLAADESRPAARLGRQDRGWYLLAQRLDPHSGGRASHADGHAAGDRAAGRRPACAWWPAAVTTSTNCVWSTWPRRRSSTRSRRQSWFGLATRAAQDQDLVVGRRRRHAARLCSPRNELSRTGPDEPDESKRPEGGTQSRPPFSQWRGLVAAMARNCTRWISIPARCAKSICKARPKIASRKSAIVHTTSSWRATDRGFTSRTGPSRTVLAVDPVDLRSRRHGSPPESIRINSHCIPRTTGCLSVVHRAIASR